MPRKGDTTVWSIHVVASDDDDDDDDDDAFALWLHHDYDND